MDFCRRVRDEEPPRSTSTSDLHSSDLCNTPNSRGSPPVVSASEPPASSRVRRKGSLRERLRQLPALTLDRRRRRGSPTLGNDSSRGTNSLSQDTDSGLPSYMRPTQASQNPRSPSGNTGCQNILRKATSSRRGSVGSGGEESPYGSQSLSHRRGSLDCLAPHPPTSPSIEYREGSPEKLWISSLRSPRGAPTPAKRVGTTSGGKKYHQPTVQGKMQPIKAYDFKNEDGGRFNRSADQNTPGRPEVPPRTKFLSPTERVLPYGSNAGPAHLTSIYINSDNEKYLGVVSPGAEDADTPRTPLKVNI